MSSDNRQAAYAAIVDYHNGLVQMRFTVAGLYLAANGFLASGYFQSNVTAVPVFALPALGLALTFVCWLLELRTYQLLANLATRGGELEGAMGIAKDHGFFSLMKNQQIGVGFLLLPGRLPAHPFVRRVVSHSFGLGVLYAVVAAFWVFVLVLHH